jgi:plastocyanin
MNKKYALVLAVLVVFVGAVAYASAYMAGPMNANTTGALTATPVYGGNTNQPTGDYQPNPSTSTTQTTTPDNGQTTTPATGGQTSTPTVSQPQTYDIKMQGYAFNPATLNIKVGDTVRWTNYDSAGHNVVSATFSSNTMNTGDTFQHTFTTPGTYSYVCTFHANMKATIIVQ